MYDEIAFALESFAAGGTIEIEFTRVRGRVLCEADLAAKCLFACRTLKRLLACMLAHVLLQFVIRSILFTAFVARLRSPFPFYRW